MLFRSTAKKVGATATITVRADSAYYNRDVVAAALAGGAHFSLTARMDPAVTAAISRADVGAPNWSSTTRSSSRSPPSRSIVRMPSLNGYSYRTKIALPCGATVGG